jgi:hypothetical protein
MPRVRNQQVIGSSPIAGSNRINHLRKIGDSPVSTFSGLVSTRGFHPWKLDRTDSHVDGSIDLMRNSYLLSNLTILWGIWTAHRPIRKRGNRESTIDRI